MPFLCLYVYITCELAYLNTDIIQWNTCRFTFQIIAASKHSAWPYPFMQPPTKTAPCKQHWQFTVQVGMYVPYCECILWCLACNHPSPCGGKAWQYCEHHLYLWNKWYTCISRHQAMCQPHSTTAYILTWMLSTSEGDPQVLQSSTQTRRASLVKCL